MQSEFQAILDRASDAFAMVRKIVIDCQAMQLQLTAQEKNIDASKDELRKQQNNLEVREKKVAEIENTIDLKKEAQMLMKNAIDENNRLALQHEKLQLTAQEKNREFARRTEELNQQEERLREAAKKLKKDKEEYREKIQEEMINSVKK